jgi:hypothetical protein
MVPFPVLGLLYSLYEVSLIWAGTKHECPALPFHRSHFTRSSNIWMDTEYEGRKVPFEFWHYKLRYITRYLLSAICYVHRKSYVVCEMRKSGPGSSSSLSDLESARVVVRGRLGGSSGVVVFPFPFLSMPSPAGFAFGLDRIALPVP